MRNTGIEPPANFPLQQEPLRGMNLEWKIWRTLNRMRTGVAPVKSNLAKWKLTNADEVLCDCGEVQTTDHLRTCIHCPSKCTLDDLWLADTEALDVARYWAEKL